MCYNIFTVWFQQITDLFYNEQKCEQMAKMQNLSLGCFCDFIYVTQTAAV